MKKRILMIIMAGLCLCMLAGCGGNSEEESSAAVVSTPAPTIAPTPVPVQMAKIVVVDADGGLNVRAEASTDGEVLGLADDGERLPLLVEDPKDGWYQVSYEGKTAYVYAEYAKVQEVTLDEYNTLKEGGDTASATGSAVSSPEPDASEPVSSATPEPSASPSVNPAEVEDGE